MFWIAAHSIEVLETVDPIPLPSAIHYEVPLQLLEQQTLRAVSQRPAQRQLVNELVITLRKALALQRRIEESCTQERLAIEYRWSPENSRMNSTQAPKA